MSVTSTTRPTTQPRKSSRVPGGFETDNEADVESNDDSRVVSDNIQYGNGMAHSHDNDQSFLSLPSGGSSSPLLPTALGRHDESHVNPKHNESTHGILAANNTVLEEQEMNRKLGEYESSFLPELSHLSIEPAPQSVHRTDVDSRKEDDGVFTSEQESDTNDQKVVVGKDQLQINDHFSSPKTPPGMYRTPAPEQQELRLREQNEHQDSSFDIPNTSALEQMSFSRSAERTVSRVQSMATIGGYETADDREFPDSPSKKAPRISEDPEATPRKTNDPVQGKSQTESRARAPSGSDLGSPNVARRRPKYLNSRSSSARLSFDSMASSTTETSEATLGADFAIQSGGAVPELRLQRKPRMTLSRSTSLGSIVSGVSNMSDDEGGQLRKQVTNSTELGPLQEETPVRSSVERLSPNATLITPKASNANISMPTDTVVANHVRDLQVPGTFARQYRQMNPIISPEKPMSMATMTPGPKKGLTLKEHRSTVEKLGKENFDLKMKIHFLDQALQRRSEDGVKEIITENVQLKSDRMRLEKENHSLRKQVRELQKKIDSADGESRDSPTGDQGYGTDEDRSPTLDEEVIYLRERIETSEIEIEKLRSENISKEAEKRRLADLVKNLGDTRAAVSDVGSREERDMWKDMLESETIAREQSEEENKRLREELAKVRQDVLGHSGKHKRSRIGGSIASRSSSMDGSAVVKSDGAETERLRHEVSELQKMISAQASTLTSRNKEKERLYQEIEDLKLGRMSGVRSVAGDSIFDRSASRARSNSRASNGTRFTRLSEPEREQFEGRIGDLRDEVSQLKLDNQNLQNEFNEALAELDALDQQAQDDLQVFNEELAELVQERDNLLVEVEQQDAAFQQLKAEAQEEIDGLGDELDAKVEECGRLEEELKAQIENVNVLQNEVRSTSEGLARLEADSQQSVHSYKNAKSELEEAQRQMERLGKNVAEAEAKVQRLTVQQESSHNEIAFLREEQDGDKIKIGDLESLLKKTHLNLDTEREKAKDLEKRLNEERSQHDSVSNKEKQEVQRMLNDLNREASTAKDELRRVRKALSSRDLELTTHKEHLSELEASLRSVLKEPSGSRASLVANVAKMQRELETAAVDLDRTSKRLDDHQNLLANRDVLLESSGLECRKLADMLERERLARRQDKHSFEQSLKSHQQAARALSSNNARVVELEQARSGHRKQLSQLEAQFKDQLAERNQVLLTVWKKLSVLCGADWAHNHSLINGNLPSQEVVGNMLFWPGFSRNLLLAAKQVEGILTTLRDKIKRTDRELWRDYQTLEQQLEQRSRKLERIEELWEKMKLRQQEIDAGLSNPLSRPGTGRDSAVQKLQGENRALKAELQMMQQQHTHVNHARSHNRAQSRASGFSNGALSMDGAASGFGGGIPVRHSSMSHNGMQGVNHVQHAPAGIAEHLAGDLPSRSHSALSGPSQGGDWNNIDSPDRDRERKRRSLIVPPQGYLESDNQPNGNFARPPVLSPIPQVTHNGAQTRPPSSVANISDAATITTAQLMNMPGNQAQWIHRLRELERRLKHEREQRLVDRTGMRKRLEEKESVNEELRRELERERVRGSWDDGYAPNGSLSSAGAEHLSQHNNNHHIVGERSSRGSGQSEVFEDAEEENHDREQDRTSTRRKFGIPSLNNRVFNVGTSAARR